MRTAGFPSASFPSASLSSAVPPLPPLPVSSGAASDASAACRTDPEHRPLARACSARGPQAGPAATAAGIRRVITRLQRRPKPCGRVGDRDQHVEPLQRRM